MDLIFSTATTELYEEGLAVFERWRAEFPLDFLLESVYDPVIIYNGDTPVGLFEVSYDYFEEMKWIQSLWIHPNYRLRGYGSAAITHIVRTCNYPQLKLFAANHSAPFYEKHGFRNTFGSYYVKDTAH